MKNKKIGLIVFGIGIVLVLVALLLVTGVFGGKSGKDKEEEVEVIESYSGVYELDGVQLVVYQFKNSIVNAPEEKAKKVDIHYTFNYIIDSYITVENNVGSDELFDFNMKLTFTKDAVKVSLDDKTLKTYSDLKNGTYKKTKEYTDEDYYADNIGETKYIDTKYNGHYSLENVDLYSYQISENEIKISYIINDKENVVYHSNNYTLGDNGIFTENDPNENETPATVVFGDDSLTYTSSVNTKASGVYKKEGKLTIAEIIDLS